MDKAIAVGLADSEHLVVARDQPHLDAAARICARKRVDEYVNPVVRRIGGESKIGNDEPLRRLLPVITGNDVLRLGGHRIEAGSELLHGLIERKSGGHFCVELGLDRQFAVPDFRASLVGQPLGLIAAQIALELIAQKRIEEVPISDPIDRKHHRLGVDAENGNALLTGARQNIGLPRETYERFAVADKDREFRRLRERFLHNRRKTRAQRHRIAFSVFETLDAELFVVRRNRRPINTANRDKR